MVSNDNLCELIRDNAEKNENKNEKWRKNWGLIWPLFYKELLKDFKGRWKFVQVDLHHFFCKQRWAQKFSEEKS